MISVELRVELKSEAIAELLPAGLGTTLLSFCQTLRKFRFCV
ncbi:hypothetical protein [Leptolyngbya sp. CCY15150]|nr:hypothetical protein [Leptolyngbya sp. CCY15150]